MHGGRFNPRGMPALYTALRLETAWLEAQQGFARKAQPMTLCAYEADCAGVLDLTDPVVRAAHGVTMPDLACPWQAIIRRGETPPSWALAERLFTVGVAAILVPSFAIGAAPRDMNAVFWRWGAELPHRLSVIDDHQRLATRLQ